MKRLFIPLTFLIISSLIVTACDRGPGSVSATVSAPATIIVPTTTTVQAATSTPANTSVVTSSTSVPVATTPVGTKPAGVRTATPPASEILDNSLAAMGKTTSYQLDTIVTWKYGFVGVSSSFPSGQIHIFKGNRLIDIADKALQESLNDEYIQPSGTNQRTMKINEVAGYSYAEANSNGVWFKSKATDAGWMLDNQISELIALMQTSSSSSWYGSEIQAGTDCYILNIQPSIPTIADWVVSQVSSFGAADISMGGPYLGGKDAYLSYFKNGTFDIWVAKDSYLVMKAEIHPYFEATPQDLGEIPNTNRYFAFDKITSDFQGEMNFSNYNQPVAIQPPPDSSVTDGMIAR